MKDFVHGKSHETENPELNSDHEIHSVNSVISEQTNDIQIRQLTCDKAISEKRLMKQILKSFPTRKCMGILKKFRKKSQVIQKILNLFLIWKCT